MDIHATEYYSQYSEKHPQGHFHKVIALHDAPDMDWNEISSQVPRLSRGWFELSHLSAMDRIEFTRDFWLSKLPFHPKMTEFLMKFFASLDDIGIYIIQKNFEDPFDVHLVYSLSNGGGFFHGEPAANAQELIGFQKNFSEHIFPMDYIAFLEVHNGFAKWTDTGIIKLDEMKKEYNAFQEMLSHEDPLHDSKNNNIDPKSLIPFYKSFGMPFLQCFWADWYPEEEMGNVYYSGLTKSISDVYCSDCSTEMMAYTTFSDWLMFYLEKID